jgi:mRNA degradation ribonuclease J1/J2
VVSDVDPDVLVPVHTERVDWFREAFPGIVSAPPDGRINL